MDLPLEKVSNITSASLTIGFCIYKLRYLDFKTYGEGSSTAFVDYMCNFFSNRKVETKSEALHIAFKLDKCKRGFTPRDKTWPHPFSVIVNV